MSYSLARPGSGLTTAVAMNGTPVRRCGDTADVNNNEKRLVLNTRLMKQWWAWSVAAVIVVAGTIAVWVTPISLELYGKDRIQVECAPLAGGANLVDL